MRKADKNDDNKMTLKELKHFLRQINVEVDDTYAEDIFKVTFFCQEASPKINVRNDRWVIAPSNLAEM